MTINTKYISTPILQTRDNACGGFALASVLPDGANPEVIYAEIQAQQSHYTDKSRAGFLTATKGGDFTRMSLPSAIVEVAKQHKCKNIKLCCAGATLKTAFPAGLYAEEMKTLQNKCTINENATSYTPPAKSDVVHLVLVDGGQHWVSVDSSKTVYDPALGTRNFGSLNYNHLFIELS